MRDERKTSESNAKDSGLRSGENADPGANGQVSNARTQNASSAEEKEKSQGSTERLLQCVADRKADFFHDSSGEPFVTVDAEEGRRTFPIRSKGFKEWLQFQYWDRYRDAAPDTALEKIVNSLAAQAKFDGDEREVFIRVGHDEGRVYLDLANEQGQVVEIDREGWRVIDRSPVAFRQTSSMLSLPRPRRGGSLDGLRPLINAKREANWILVCGFLLAQFMPEGTMPVLAIQGPQGSAKSSTAKRIRDVIDPNANNTRTPPRNIEDVMVAARNNFLLSYDNISGGVKNSISDALCTLCSGGSMARRKLYTNHDEAAMGEKRSTIINGIDDLTPRGDLAQRSLVVRLGAIAFEPEADLIKAFQQAHPRILGALLDAVSEALLHLEAVKADPSWKRPRLVDMAAWVMAGEPALPFEKGTFLETLAREQADQRIDMMEGNALASTLRLLAGELKPGDEYAAPAEEVRNRLIQLAEREGLSIKDGTFPRSARGLSQYLRRDHDDFEQASGLIITMDPTDRDPKTRCKLMRFAQREEP